MKQLLAVLLVTVALTTAPAPLPKPSAIVLTNPTPNPDYSPRVSRTRPPLTLNNLPAKWQRLAWCESRQRLHANRHDTYYGLWQIHRGWYRPFRINPKTATLKQQYVVALHVYKTQGAKAWSCAERSNFK